MRRAASTTLPNRRPRSIPGSATTQRREGVPQRRRLHPGERERGQIGDVDHVHAGGRSTRATCAANSSLVSSRGICAPWYTSRMTRSYTCGAAVSTARRARRRCGRRCRYRAAVGSCGGRVARAPDPVRRRAARAGPGRADVPGQRQRAAAEVQGVERRYPAGAQASITEATRRTYSNSRWSGRRGRRRTGRRRRCSSIQPSGRFGSGTSSAVPNWTFGSGDVGRSDGLMLPTLAYGRQRHVRARGAGARALATVRTAG